MDPTAREAHLTAWSRQPLPIYGVEGWAGERHAGHSTGLPSREGERKGLMSLGVQHFLGGEMLIDVVAHRPDPEHFDDLRMWAPVNTLFAAQGAPGVSADQRSRFQQAADDLTSGRPSGLVQWDPVAIYVDGEPTSFELCRIVGDYWSAIAARSEVHLTLHSRGLPASKLSLVRIELPDEPTRSVEDS